jgi:hypothetical protein
MTNTGISRLKGGDAPITMRREAFMEKTASTSRLILGSRTHLGFEFDGRISVREPESDSRK